MATERIVTALQRVRAILQRRPERGLHDDAPAAARWEYGTRVVAKHANGTQLSTDMPGELGGSGDQVTPGWLFRAGIASCLATTIAMSAAEEGIALTMLQVEVKSRSDTRGLLGMTGADGTPIRAEPVDVQIEVQISARGVSSEQTRSLVARSFGRAPIPAAVRSAVPVVLQIDIGIA